ncbi:MAG: peptidoglycan DD-metalloendopeptidase family protein [Pacificimonas sp.]|nr:peptidoglycan DD-metalloendopeptidase family protein [Pacificimonas sp.]
MISKLFTSLAGKVSSLFVDREIYMRSNDKLSFLTISAAKQRVALITLGTVFLGWLVLSGNLLASQLDMLAERSSVAAMLSDAQDTYRDARQKQRSAAERASELEARQEALEGLATEYFRLPSEESSLGGTSKLEESAVRDPLSRLAAVKSRQADFIAEFERLARERATRAELAVSNLGLDLERLTRTGAARGGPLVPASFDDADDLLRLSETIYRLDRLERALLSVPSFAPAESGSLSSGYGLRRDPFTRRAAMHQGQDFRGPHRSAIRAAASGTVVRAGWWAGYGRVVVIDHGAGIETRYAHLAAFDVKKGDIVQQGDRIGGMGSSGRSTGTHLHFEVRIDGKAVNPRPFLEAPDHVLQIQAAAGERLHAQPQDL